jgi:putative transposase
MSIGDKRKDPTGFAGGLDRRNDGRDEIGGYMAVGYFEPGQKILWEGMVQLIEEVSDDKQVRLKSTQTGRRTCVDLNKLEDAYVQGELRFISISVNTPEGFENERAEKIVATLDRLSDKERDVVTFRYAYVRAVVDADISGYTPKNLLPIIMGVWLKLGGRGECPSWSSVYRWVRRFLQEGSDIRALTSRHHKKGNRIRRYENDVIEMVRIAVQSTYLKPERNNVATVLECAETIVRRENNNRAPSMRLPSPSRYLVESAIKELDPFTVAVAREGRMAAIKKFRNITGYVVAEQVLERAEIDHTTLDLILVDDKTGIPLGRPTVTVCIDVMSRCILGVYVGFEPPSYVSVMHCLRHAFFPKNDLKSKFPSVEGDWDAYGVMRTLVVDNGREFHGVGLESLAYSFNINIQYAPRRTPWFKPYVERFIKELNKDVAHTNPGTTFSNITSRGDYDAEKNAVITQSSFMEILMVWIVDYYHAKTHSTIGMPPIVMWRENVGKISVPLPDDVRDFEFLCSIPGNRSLSHKGVSVNNLYYNSEELGDMRKRLGDTITVEVRYSNADIGHIYVVDPVTNSPIRVPAVDISYASGMTAWAHKLCVSYARHQMSGSEKGGLLSAKQKISSLAQEAMGNKKLKTRARVKRFLDATRTAEEPAEQSHEAPKVEGVGVRTSGMANLIEAACEPIDLEVISSFNAQKESLWR